MRKFVFAVTALMLFLPIVASAADDELRPAAFDDVPATHTFAAAIDWFAQAGITQGCNPPANTRFCPEDPVTRGQMAAFLMRALNLPAYQGPDRFSDDAGVFETAIERLAQAGITQGCNPPANTRFCPSSPVTRGQMAGFLARALNLPSYQGPDRFSDDAGVFEAAIERLAQAGITQGCNPPSNSRFCPDNPVTRGQMAGFLRRALEDVLVLPDTPLVNLELVDSRRSPRVGGFELGGRTFPNSVRQGTANLLDNTDFAEYLLGRDYTDFCAVVGVWDLAPRDATVDAEITLDGEIAWNEVVTLGSPVSISIPIDNALRLRLTIREAEVDASFVDAVWGSAVVAQDGQCDVPTGGNPATPSLAFLSDLDDIVGDPFLDVGGVSLDGVLYSRSVTQTTANKLDEDHRTTYYLGRDYARFCAVVGVLDDISDATATADLDVVADGVSIASPTVEVGNPVVPNLNVSGVLRMELITTEGGTPTNSTEAGWGNARITKSAC